MRCLTRIEIFEIALLERSEFDNEFRKLSVILSAPENIALVVVLDIIFAKSTEAKLSALEAGNEAGTP